MAPLKTRNTWILAALETGGYAVDPTPVAADAILCRTIEVQPLAANTVEVERIKGYYGANPMLIASKTTTATLEVEHRHDRAGLAPLQDVLLQSCAMLKTSNASTVTGTAQAGGANSITLAVGASATDDAYQGQVISFTAGTESGEKATIVTYNGTTKVATFAPHGGATLTPDGTTEYQIEANTTYTLTSLVQGQSNNSLTGYAFMDQNRHAMNGARGNVSFSIATNQIPYERFTFQGLYVDPAAASTPKPNFVNTTAPQVVNTDNTPVININGYNGCLVSFDMDLGNDVQHFDRAGCSEYVDIMDRNVTGTIVIEAPTVDVKDFFTETIADTVGPLTITHGSEVGKFVTIILPFCDFGNPTYGDDRGHYTLQIPFTGIPQGTGDNEFRLVYS